MGFMCLMLRRKRLPLQQRPVEAGAEERLLVLADLLMRPLMHLGSGRHNNYAVMLCTSQVQRPSAAARGLRGSGHEGALPTYLPACACLPACLQDVCSTVMCACSCMHSRSCAAVQPQP
jgi:hypothetical protein